MTNLTISLDKETLRKARIRALKEGTSVNRILQEYLSRYAGQVPQGTSEADRIVALLQSSKASSGGERRWKRDDLYEERFRR